MRHSSAFLVFLIVGIIFVGLVFYNEHHKNVEPIKSGSEMITSKSSTYQSSSSMNISTSSNYSIEEVMKSRPDYFGLGLYSKPVYPDGLFKKAVYNINNSFSGYILLANAKGNDYLIFVLLDYHEVPFYLNGTLNLTHHVILGNMKYEFLRFVIPNVSPGWHDVFIGVFSNPYSTEEQGSHVLYGFRLQLISKAPLLNLPEFKHPSICTKNNTELDAYLLLTKKSCDNVVWYRTAISQNSTLLYSAVVGNTKDNLQTFALVQFLDYKQVPIGNNTVYYGYIYKNELASIPLSVDVPKIGTHYLVLLYFAYPYEPLDYPPGVENVNLRFINEQSNILIIHVG